MQAITGAEVTLSDGSHVVLLAETAQGYTNLCRLLTETHWAPSASIRDCRSLARSASRRADHSLRLPPRWAAAANPRGAGAQCARRLAEHCKAVFGEKRFFVEIQRNRVRGDLAASRALLESTDQARKLPSWSVVCA